MIVDCNVVFLIFPIHTTFQSVIIFFASFLVSNQWQYLINTEIDEVFSFGLIRFLSGVSLSLPQRCNQWAILFLFYLCKIQPFAYIFIP
jgi:hypothetical protein